MGTAATGPPDATGAGAPDATGAGAEPLGAADADATGAGADDATGAADALAEAVALGGAAPPFGCCASTGTLATARAPPKDKTFHQRMRLLLRCGVRRPRPRPPSHSVTRPASRAGPWSLVSSSDRAQRR